MTKQLTQSISRPAIWLLLLALVAAVLGLAGCGGSGESSDAGTGRATLKIIWPEPSPLLPVASKNITVSFLNDRTVVASQTVNRPSSGNESTVTFPTLPAIELTLKAEAFPNTGGTGVAQASASKSINIVRNQTIDASITMDSTIVGITITPGAPVVKIGDTLQLVATPYDSQGRTVLVTGATRSFTSANPSIATVDSSGLVTGISEGATKVTVADSESGISAFVTVTVKATDAATIVELATTYLNSLDTNQKNATLVSKTAANAAKWSNLAAAPNADGSNDLRNGVAYSSLTTAQKAAWDNLVKEALGTKGWAQLTQIRAAENYLATFSTGYSGDYVYVGFVGEPNAGDTWLLQIGGHQFTVNSFYDGLNLQTTTPTYLAVEPASFVLSGTTYTPMAEHRDAMFNLINSLTGTQLATAKLSSTFAEVLLGPGDDSRSLFPTGTTNRGILGSDLTSSQKALLRTAMAAWTQNSPLASSYKSLYDSEIDSTYVAYSGTTALNLQGDYVRIDGPHVWIEFLVVNGAVASGQVGYQSVWRDRVTDYNQAFGF